MARARREIEQLAELLDSGADVGQASGELAELMALASSVQNHVTLPSPSSDFRAALRSELLAMPPVATAPLPSGLGERARRFLEQRAPELQQSSRAVAATAAGAALLASGGVVTAAQQSLPGDLLYGIKGTTEEVRLSFANGDAERGRLHLGFAEERLAEVEDGVTRLTSDLLSDTLGRLDDEVVTAADLLLGVFREQADLAIVHELTGFTSAAAERLQALAATLPAEVVPVAEATEELLRRIDLEVAVATGERVVSEVCDVCGPADNPFESGSFVITRPGDGPAVPVTECDCAAAPAPAPTPAPAPDSTPDSTPEPSDEPSDEPTPEPEPEPEPRDIVPPLPGPLAPLGDQVEDQVNDLLDLLPVDPIEQLPAPVREPAEDVLEQTNQTVGDVSAEIDNQLP